MNRPQLATEIPEEPNDSDGGFSRSAKHHGGQVAFKNNAEVRVSNLEPTPPAHGTSDFATEFSHESLGHNSDDFILACFSKQDSPHILENELSYPVAAKRLWVEEAPDRQLGCFPAQTSVRALVTKAKIVRLTMQLNTNLHGEL
jgi:hypothetical protein